MSTRERNGAVEATAPDVVLSVLTVTLPIGDTMPADPSGLHAPTISLVIPVCTASA